jgi:hypothetical protein
MACLGGGRDGWRDSPKRMMLATGHFGVHARSGRFESWVDRWSAEAASACGQA